MSSNYCITSSLKADSLSSFEITIVVFDFIPSCQESDYHCNFEAHHSVPSQAWTDLAPSTALSMEYISVSLCTMYNICLLIIRLNLHSGLIACLPLKISIFVFDFILSCQESDCHCNFEAHHSVPSQVWTALASGTSLSMEYLSISLCTMKTIWPPMILFWLNSGMVDSCQHLGIT